MMSLRPLQDQISNLVIINFSNGYKISFDLKYPYFLIVKQIQDTFIKTLPDDEWINLIINVVKDEKKNNVTLLFFANGENNLTVFPLQKPNISNNDTITSIRFFNNFYGEVSSMTFLYQKDIS